MSVILITFAGAPQVSKEAISKVHFKLVLGQAINIVLL